MNTLGKTKTVEFFNSPEGFENIQKIWRSKREHTAVEHLFYQILRGKDYLKSFAEATNANKVANGHNEGHVVTTTLRGIHYPVYRIAVPEIFRGELVDNVMEKLKLVVPVSRPKENGGYLND